MTDKNRTFSIPSLLLPFLLALTLSLFHLRLSSYPPKNETLNLTLTRNYIVRFLEYKKAEDHRAYLETNLGSLERWRWIERKNPASAFPTDFGVLAIEDWNGTALIDEIGRLGRVKDVFADSSYSRSLFVEGSERGGAFSNGKKRPGKLFTSMSFGEEEEEEENYRPVRNCSIRWERNLLMQVSRIAF